MAAMQYAELGRTGEKVARICLGTVFRAELDEQTHLAALREAVAQFNDHWCRRKERIEELRAARAANERFLGIDNW